MLEAGLMLGLFCFGCQDVSLVVSVNRILDYAFNSGENSDAFLLGAFLAKAQIKASEDLTTDRYKLNELDRISYKLDMVLSRSVGFIDPEAVKKTDLFRNLDKVRRLEEKRLNYTLSDPRYLELGVPSRYESDECMLPLLEGCKQPAHCLQSMSNTFSTGYSLIHRALFLSLFNLMGCNEDQTRNDEIMENIASICSQVYAESVQISDLGFPLTLQDLFIEQVGVCGLHLYKEFLSTKNLNFILKKSKLFHSRFGIKKRFYKSTWDSHLSGVGLAALSAFITQINLLSSGDINRNLYRK